MNITSRSLTLAFAIASAALTPTAQAIPMLRVSDGSGTLTFTDNGAGDVQPAAGQVVFVGTIGNWSFNVHTGTTYPAVGTPSNPYMDLSFNATSTSAGGTLVVSFSADGFGPSSGSSELAIGGTIAAGGLVTYQAFGGTDNLHFSTGNLLGSIGPLGPVAFSAYSTGGSVNNPGPYSLTQQVMITHAGAGQTTGDALLRVPEGGSTMLLLGMAVFAVGIVARLRPGRV